MRRKRHRLFLFLVFSFPVFIREFSIKKELSVKPVVGGKSYADEIYEPQVISQQVQPSRRLSSRWKKIMKWMWFMVILIVNRDFDLVHGEETDYICSFCCSSFPEVLPYVCLILRRNMLQLFNCFFFFLS